MPSNNPKEEKRDLLFASALAAVVAGTLMPTLRYGFVYQGAQADFLSNPAFRGLGPEHFKWIFLQFQPGGAYQPLTWLTHAVDFYLWGLTPTGYHLGNLLLACAGAVALYFLTFRTLRLALRSRETEETALRLCAAFSSALYWLHPQRVEVYAGGASRGYLLGGLLTVLSLNTYLKAHDQRKPPSRPWLAAAATFFAASLLAAPIGIALPLVFIVADVYLLRRTHGSIGMWELVGEKLPLILLSLAVVVVGANGFAPAGVSAVAPAIGLWSRVGQAAYQAMIYPMELLVPIHLAPGYPLPTANWQFLIGLLVVATISILTWIGRNRRHWPLVVWVTHILTLIPSFGFWADSIPRTAADSWFLLAAVPWTLLAGGLLFEASRRIKTRASRIILGFATASVLAVLAGLSLAHQCFWRNTDALFARELSVQPACYYCEHEWADSLIAQGRQADALPHEFAALRINPDYQDSIVSAQRLSDALGKTDDSLRLLRELARLRPDDAILHLNLGLNFARLGRIAEAAAQTRESLRLDPTLANAHNNLGFFLMRLGRPKEAVAELEEALRLDPGNVMARGNLAAAQQQAAAELPPEQRAAVARDRLNRGVSAFNAGRMEEALADFRAAAALDPSLAASHFNLGFVLHSTGRLNEAAAEYREAIRLAPRASNAYVNLGVLLTSQGKLGEADEMCSAAAKLDAGAASNTHCYRSKP